MIRIVTLAVLIALASPTNAQTIAPDPTAPVPPSDPEIAEAHALCKQPDHFQRTGDMERDFGIRNTNRNGRSPARRCASTGWWCASTC